MICGGFWNIGLGHIDGDGRLSRDLERGGVGTQGDRGRQLLHGDRRFEGSIHVVGIHNEGIDKRIVGSKTVVCTAKRGSWIYGSPDNWTQMEIRLRGPVRPKEWNGGSTQTQTQTNQGTEGPCHAMPRDEQRSGLE